MLNFFLNKSFLLLFSIIFIVSCTSEKSSQNLITEEQTFVFSISNFKESVKSYEQLNISISANYECNFNITGKDIFWAISSDNKDFSYRAPITVLDEEEFFIDISTVETIDLSLIHI